MSTRAMKNLLVAALIGAVATSVLGCADIIGADFDHRFDNGAGGAGGAGVGATSAATTGSTATTTTTTGGDTFACDLGNAGSFSKKVTIIVKAKAGKLDGNTGAEGFYSARKDILSAPFDYIVDLGTYNLFATAEEGRVALFQCDAPSNTHITTEGVPGCVCLGYALKGEGSPLEYVPLYEIIGNEPTKTALVPNTNNCDKYGAHPNGGTGCTPGVQFSGQK
jgi:hypothetical protein